MQSAWKVGLLGIVFLGCLFGAYGILGRTIGAKAEDIYPASFANAGGIVAGSPVMMAGVRVGVVKSVRLASASEAIVILGLDKGTKIPEGTKAVISSSLVGIGDRPIDLVPPASYGSTLLKPGNVLVGQTKSALESMAPESQATLQSLNDTLKATQMLLEDKDLKNGVVGMLESGTKTSTEFGKLAADLRSVMNQNASTLSATLNKANAMMDDLQKTTKAVSRLATDGKFEGKVTTLLDSMNATLVESNKLVADLRATVNDPELQKPMKEILANSQSMTASGVKVADSGVKIAADAELMAKNGVVVSEKAIGLMDKAGKLADELSEVLKKFDGALGKVAEIGKSNPVGGGSISMETVATVESNPGRFRNDFEAKLATKNENYYFGLWDAFEGNKLIAQVGRPLTNNSEFRYGVYASKPGIGVSYAFAPRWTLRGDLFDVNDPRMDLRMRFDMDKKLSGWFGMERIFGSPSPSFGISIRR
jgi:phospholipid/cholesterol/gamma-HCH transport system substrate-binding protein